MENLNIVETGFSPRINFNSVENHLTIEGRSLPEDVREFYDPVFEWLSNYLNGIREPAKLTFKLDYFNTASAKIIVDILFRFHEVIKKGIPVEVLWYYQEYDEDMQEVGVRFAEITGVDIKVISL